jgi:hypothetical protein
MFNLSPEASDKIISMFVGVSILFALGHILNLALKSPKLTKFLSVRNYLLLLVFFIGGSFISGLAKHTANSEPIKWNSENTLMLRDKVWYTLDSLGFPFSIDQKRTVSDCMVGKIKLSFPKGIPKTDAPVNKEIEKNFKICMAPIFVTGKMEGWTPKFEEFLITRFVDDESLTKYYPDFNDRFKIASCLTRGIKKQYPDGIDWKDLNNTIEKIMYDCK